MSERTSFPDGFRWGTATAAHQIEGGNWNNDWWRWEHTPGTGCAESSGDACDSWNRWPEDVALLAELGFDSYRFSIEWSRIEPEDGEHGTAALDHYLRIGEALLEAGIDPVITFHHFTTPRWLADRGGWVEPATADRFAAFCERAAAHLAPVMRRAWDVTNGEVPILVTENGIGTDDDTQRIDYVRTALAGVLHCLDDGIDVRGYTCWSLLDNFEWLFGYGPRFGLVSVDRTTFERTAKDSARWLGRVARANALVD